MDVMKQQEADKAYKNPVFFLSYVKKFILFNRNVISSARLAQPRQCRRGLYVGMYIIYYLQTVEVTSLRENNDSL